MKEGKRDQVIYDTVRFVMSSDAPFPAREITAVAFELREKAGKEILMSETSCA
jgi:hypothetical protein